MTMMPDAASPPLTVQQTREELTRLARLARRLPNSDAARLAYELSAIRTLGGRRRYLASEVNALLRGDTGQQPETPSTDRDDLTGHTITVETVTDAIRARAMMPVASVGKLAVLERTDGRLGKVCAVVEATDGRYTADVARSLAAAYGATFVEVAR
ncbi:hypothetical protein [Thermomonospora cellulosilytica]|uniref:Uncharacterized protein n=1 Tax=Thermomonospora cellulosilytica TaxID=1411118 RepID=A0A7W3R7Y4_9ACTN|nr:hypothetical protein [Thermomonospora cellulosilytica]MBA9003703.1 hypothetical protein [Thermomonospora cellulosilytica]